MSGRTEYVTVNYQDDFGLSASGKARKLLIDGKEHWIPVSVIGYQDEVSRAVEVAKWFCEKEDIPYVDE